MKLLPLALGLTLLITAPASASLVEHNATTLSGRVSTLSSQVDKLSSPVNKINSPIGTIRPAIAGGQPAPVGSYPYAVRVQVKLSSRDPYQLLCSGALIAPRYILTAAHCLNLSPLEFDQTLPQSQMRVRFSNIEGAPAIKVKRTAYWRDFNIMLVGSEPQSDVAILELVEDAPTAPAELADSGPLGQLVTELGYGPTQPKEADGEAKTLVTGQMKTADSAVCSGKISGYYVKSFSTTEICTKDELPILTAGACHGDSGGPLLENGKIIGVTSWSKVENCDASAGSRQTVFARLYPARDWLRQQTGAALFAMPAVEQNLTVPTNRQGRITSINRSRAIFAVSAQGSDWKAAATVAITATTKSKRTISYGGIANLTPGRNQLLVSYPRSWKKLKLKKISVDGYVRFYNQVNNGASLLVKQRSITVKR